MRSRNAQTENRPREEPRVTPRPVRARPYQTGSAPKRSLERRRGPARPRADGLVPPRVSSVHAQLAPWVNSCLGSSERCERESGLVQLPLGGGGRGRLQGYHSLDRLDAARETGQGMDF